MARMTVQQALRWCADNPESEDAVPVEQPVWQLIGHALFRIANSPNPKVRGGLARASRAQRLLLNRMVGTRRPGTHPAARSNHGITFYDLTQGEIE